MISDQKQRILLSIIKSWQINSVPEYRGFRCGHCQMYINKAWHHWIHNRFYKLPLHLCSDCEDQFNDDLLQLPLSRQEILTHDTFKATYHYSPNTIKRFIAIVSQWPNYKRSVLKIFTCDECGQILDIDTPEKIRKGYHVWWKINSETLTELHFHKKCAYRLQIA